MRHNVHDYVRKVYFFDHIDYDIELVHFTDNYCRGYTMDYYKYRAYELRPEKFLITIDHETKKLSITYKPDFSKMKLLGRKGIYETEKAIFD